MAHSISGRMSPKGRPEGESAPKRASAEGSPVSARPFVWPAQWLLAVALLLLSGTQALAGSIALAWDPVGDPRLAGYKVYYGTSSRNYSGQIDVGNVTTRTVSGLTDGAKYYFAVTAYDGSRIESGFSNEVVGTVPSAVPVANFTASTTTGVAPLAMNFTSTSTGTISNYAWTFGDGTTSSSQNPAKTYSTAGVFNVGLTVTGPSGTNTKTVPNYITVTTTVDTTPPSAPSSFTATASGSTTINLAWTASTDNVGVTGYRVERCQGASCTSFSQIATPPGTTFSNTGLAVGTTYRYRVRAIDAAGNLSAYSAIATAMTAVAPDTTPPTAPSGFTTTASGSTTINLAWMASTDNVGVTGYRVERCQGASCTSFAQIASPTGTTFSNTGLAAGTTYRYRVRAIDAAGNLSAYSSIATATTAATADTTPATAPSGFTAITYSSSTLNLAWTASTDNVGVTGYRVERCQGSSCTSFVQIASPTGTTFSNSGLPASTTYRYRVRATDAAGNLSAYSSIATATTTPLSDAPPR